MNELLRIPVCLLPVVVFLIVLNLLDSYKLVSSRNVLTALAIGALAASASFLVNLAFVFSLGVDLPIVQRYLAPVTEELLKALGVIYLIKSHRVGFLVDAAIYGFAIGAGFALLENVYYLRSIPQASIFLWIVRGFGTGVLHGSTTAILAMLSKALSDRYAPGRIWVFVPGMALAIAIHSIFNHIPIHPLLMTIVILVSMPLLVVLVFARSEAATREWLGGSFDADVELLELIESGELPQTRIGQYLSALKNRFPGEVVADMLCLLQIQLELSVRAKGMLLAREAGIRLVHLGLEDGQADPTAP